MRFLKRFNEDLEGEIQNEGGEKYTGCIDTAKQCIEDCTIAMDNFKDAEDLESVIKTNECILACELYIYSCENETKNFKAIADLMKTIAKDVAELKVEKNLAETSCLKLVSEIEKCEESKEDRGVI